MGKLYDDYFVKRPARRAVTETRNGNLASYGNAPAPPFKEMNAVTKSILKGGRPKKADALSNADRQRAFRARRKAT